MHNYSKNLSTFRKLQLLRSLFFNSEPKQLCEEVCRSRRKQLSFVWYVWQQPNYFLFQSRAVKVKSKANGYAVTLRITWWIKKLHIIEQILKCFKKWISKSTLITYKSLQITQFYRVISEKEIWGLRAAWVEAFIRGGPIMHWSGGGGITEFTGEGSGDQSSPTEYKDCR